MFLISIVTDLNKQETDNDLKNNVFPKELNY